MLSIYIFYLKLILRLILHYNGTLFQWKFKFKWGNLSSVTVDVWERWIENSLHLLALIKAINSSPWNVHNFFSLYHQKYCYCRFSWNIFLQFWDYTAHPVSGFWFSFWKTTQQLHSKIFHVILQLMFSLNCFRTR